MTQSSRAFHADHWILGAQRLLSEDAAATAVYAAVGLIMKHRRGESRIWLPPLSIVAGFEPSFYERECRLSIADDGGAVPVGGRDTSLLVATRHGTRQAQRQGSSRRHPGLWRQKRGPKFIRQVARLGICSMKQVH